MSNPREAHAMELFTQAQVVIPGHFVGTSGKHLDAYFRKDETIKDPDLLEEVTGLMADQVAETFTSDDFDIIVGIAPCSSQLATGISTSLVTQEAPDGTILWQRMPPIAFAEKSPSAYLNEEGEPKVREELIFKRGFNEDIEGKRVLLVEDVLTTGKSLRELLALVQKIKGTTVVGAIAEFNRSPTENTAEAFGIPVLLSLVAQEMPMHPKDDCPMCKAGIAVRTDYGHGQKFLDGVL